MAIVLNGSTGIQNVLGSASAPADTNTTTPTTGIYYPSATTWGVSTAGTNALYIDASQNVGIGTTSPVGKLDVVSTAQDQLSVRSNSKTAGSSILVSSGNGTTSNNYSYIQYQNAQTSAYNWKVGTFGSNSFSFYDATAAAERMRIDTSGNLLVGSTSNYGGVKLLVAQPNNNSAFIVNNTTASPTANTIWSNYSAAASTNFVHFYATTSGNSVANFQVLGNGNVQNSNNSYGAFSDVSLKDNIVDATSKLDDLMKVQIRNYTLKNDPDKIKQIGVIAQELEIVFPSIVEEIKDRDQDGKLLETTTKSVKYSVFVPMLIKAIQELKADFDAYKAAHP